ncbi:hypothetical protein PRIPAC_78843 [Pristionchus pacificus]|uniref:Uncharacterized protein n=1 Tax=Pristionchus pacificus TaxID=54126 RepID=A0A2A6BXE0_PRIPA|nr:hypothetical protein PRIPAC_78843 [Pristionchus pacificus]|eukprot:PDM70421.1 hypothetical protein PRIPAC_46667 [Pristionchus pacificus]
MRYYRVEVLPLILTVVEKSKDRARILATLRRHISVELGALQLGKDRGRIGQRTRYGRAGCRMPVFRGNNGLRCTINLTNSRILSLIHRSFYQWLLNIFNER